MANKVAELLLRIKTVGEEKLDSLKENFSGIATAATVAFAAISAVVVKSIADYREQEQATNSLTRAMINNGVYTKALRDEYLANASALQSLTTFGDEQIINAQGILQRFLGQTKVSKELTQATLDLAAAKKIDLATAAELVGKSVGTSTNALARNGVEVTANASQQQKLSEVMAGLNKQFGGQAAAAAEGLGGIEQLKNAVSDVFEVIGERLAPVIGLFASGLKQLATDTSIVNPIVDTFVGTLRFLTQVGNVVVGVLKTVSEVIGVTLAAAVVATSQALQGNFKQAFATIGSIAKEGGNIVSSNYQATSDRMKAIDEAFLASKQENLAREEQMETESRARRSEAKALFAAEERTKELEQQIAQQEVDMQLLQASEEQREMMKLQARIKEQENIFKTTADAHKKLAAQQAIFNLNEQQKQLIIDQQNVKNRKDTLSLIAGLQDANNAELAFLGKAAAITQIAIETPVAVARALSAFPPPANFAAAGLVGVAMGAQAAKIAGVPLAEGGIVRARPGGIQATIGEGGQDEAVVPLDRAGEFGFGGGGSQVSITFMGPVMGDETQAREFALSVDRELLKLRQNNESVAFDTQVV